MLKVWKKSWEPFVSCLLNSTTNPAKLGRKWAGLAVLFSRQLPNGSHDFFQTFSIYFFNYFIKNPQTTIVLPFLTYNISAIGGVSNLSIFSLLFISLLLCFQAILGMLSAINTNFFTKCYMPLGDVMDDIGKDFEF